MNMAREITRTDMVTLALEDFKDELCRLYLVEDHTLEMVIAEMTARYHLVATKAQYETQFKKWGFRKNLTKGQWAVVTHEVRERERTGKESEIYINGKLINHRKVHRAMSRYGSISVADRQAASTDIFEGIRILTPPPLPTASMFKVAPPPVVVFWLPSTSGPNFDVIQTSAPSVLLRSMLDLQDYHVRHDPAGVRSLIGTSGYGALLVNDLENHTGKSGETLKCLRALLPDKMLHGRLNITLPATASDTSADLVMPDNLDHAIYMMTNDFFSAQSGISEHVYQWIKSCSQTETLRRLVLCIGATAEVLMEALLPISIHRSDIEMVKALLKAGLDLNRTKCRVGFRYDTPDLDTPLGVACRLRKLDVVRALLDAGADVNNSLAGQHYPLLNAVKCYQDASGTIYDHVDMQLVHLLIDAGADPDLDLDETPLVVAATKCNVELVTVLLQAGANPNLGGRHAAGTPLMQVIRSAGSVANIIKIVNLLIQASTNTCTKPAPRYISQAISWYTQRELSKELLQGLLDEGPRVVEPVLIAAAECGELRIVQLLLRLSIQLPEEVLDPAAQNSIEAAQSLDRVEGSVKVPPCTRDPYETSDDDIAFFTALYQGDALAINSLHIPDTKIWIHLDFMEAVRDIISRGDIAFLRSLLSSESRYQNRIHKALHLISPLPSAISQDHDEMIELLLGSDINVNCRYGSDGPTALLVAIQKRNFRLARRLLAAGAAVNVEVRNRRDKCFCRTYKASLLPAAVTWGDEELIQDLLLAGADINAPGIEDGRTALTVAVDRADLGTIEFLLNAGADVNAPAAELLGCPALAAAIRNNNSHLIHYLLSLGALLTEQCLIAATSHGVELMKTLLNTVSGRQRRTVKGFGTRALQRAILSSDAIMIEFLLSQGVDSNSYVELQFGEFVNNDDKYRPYPYAYWPIAVDGEWYYRYEWSALRTAIYHDESNDFWIVKILLKNGANPNKALFELPLKYEPERGLNATPLLAAIRYKKLQLVKILIAAGAMVNPKSMARIVRTPLQLAAEQGDMEIVEELLRCGADVNAPAHTEFGATALQFAAMKGYLAIVSVLLSNNADINARPAPLEGRTALEGASEHGRVDIVQLLLQNGAQLIGAGKRQYERARSYAAENGHMAIQRLLDSCHAIQSDPSSY